MDKAKRVFSRYGFAQLAGIAAIVLIGLLISVESVQKVILNTNKVVILLSMYLPNFCFMLVFWLIVRSIPKVEWNKEPMDFKRLFKIYAMMYLIATTLNFVGLGISSLTPAKGSSGEEAVGSIVMAGSGMGIVLTAVVGPIVEEMAFRKFMIDRLHNYGEKTVIIFSALCFGLYHHNLTQVLFATTVGIFLGYVYCKTGKVLYTIVMHCLLNGFNGIFLLLTSTGDSEAGMTALLVQGAFMAVLAIFGIVFLIRTLIKKDFVLDDSMPTAIPRQEVFKTVYLNLGVILLFAFNIYVMIRDLMGLTAFG